MNKHDRSMQKMQEVLEPELMSLAPNTILRDGDSYLVFGQYTMQREAQHWIVAQSRKDPRQFGSARTALSWCIAEKYQQHHVSAEIVRLDSEKSLLTADISTRSYLRQRMKNSNLREAVDAKLDARRLRLHGVQTSLDKYVSMAKYWQIRGFNNETARTGRTPSHKTNR